VILTQGRPEAYLERGGTSLLTFAGHDPARWIPALTLLVKDGRLPRVELRTLDGVAVRESPLLPTLRDSGFTESYRGIVLFP